MTEKILISVFCYNVGKFIFSVLEKIYSTNHHETSIIIINDYSKDNTISEIYRFIEKHKSKNIEIINNEKNMGYGYNYKLSFNFAIKHNYEKIIFVHGDGQYPPSQINTMSRLLTSNTIVFGSRFLNLLSVKENMPLKRFFANRVLTIFINLLFRRKFTEYFSGFRGYNIAEIKKIKFDDLSDKWIFEQQLQFRVMKKNMNIEEFSIQTVYDNQVSNLPPIRYCLEVIINSIVFAFFKKN